MVAALFDRTAETYDRVGVEMFKPIADRLVAELDLPAGERALDAGCGRGAALFPMARAVGPEGVAVGVDLAPGMVAASLAGAAAEGLTVDVRLGDAQDPDFEPESFDVVASSAVLFLLPDPLAALRAWHALLVPGGRVGVTTFGEYTPAWHAVDEVFKPFMPPAIASPGANPFSSDAGVEGLLAGAGFVDLRTTTMTLPVRFDDGGQWHRWTWSVGHRRTWEMIPPEHHDQVRAAAYEALNQCRDAEGRIGFDQAIRFTLGRRP
jgi:SAM-dependent methyltransferase